MLACTAQSVRMGVLGHRDDNEWGRKQRLSVEIFLFFHPSFLSLVRREAVLPGRRSPPRPKRAMFARGSGERKKTASPKFFLSNFFNSEGSFSATWQSLSCKEEQQGVF